MGRESRQRKNVNNNNGAAPSVNILEERKTSFRVFFSFIRSRSDILSITVQNQTKKNMSRECFLRTSRKSYFAHVQNTHTYVSDRDTIVEHNGKCIHIVQNGKHNEMSGVT